YTAPPTPETYPLSLHDALPILKRQHATRLGTGHDRAPESLEVATHVSVALPISPMIVVRMWRRIGRTWTLPPVREYRGQPRSLLAANSCCSDASNSGWSRFTMKST